ncbi:MAG: 8-amino-7-oxononanoate synthase [Steroidobacteraceae bacterium]
MSKLDATLRDELDAIAAADRYRRRRVVEVFDPATPAQVRVDGRDCVNFCSNDYLGLATHAVVRRAMSAAAERYGAGSGAAHLVTGHSPEHHALEAELAAFVGRERALLFSTGYMANLGVATALLGRGDAVFEDRLNHASLLDAGLLSGARFVRYAHNDASALQSRLSASTAARKLVLTDGVFSMDGDCAPLVALAQTCAQHEAHLMVDDAHGFGVLGEQGQGSVWAAGLSEEQVPIYMATLGKAAGVSGAFVAGSSALIETLIQKARTYIYTTAAPPAVATATRASLRLIQREGWRRDHLHHLIARFRQGAKHLGLRLMESATAIQPIVLGTAADALTASQVLLERGFLVAAIRPPTVPAGTARLRVTLSAAHSEKDVDRLLEALTDLPAVTARAKA